jgi:hypothetical protein
MLVMLVMSCVLGAGSRGKQPPPETLTLIAKWQVYYIEYYKIIYYDIPSCR